MSSSVCVLNLLNVSDCDEYMAYSIGFCCDSRDSGARPCVGTKRSESCKVRMRTPPGE